MCASRVYLLCITCTSCVCVHQLYLYILCVTSLIEKKRTAEVQRQQAMARLQNEMALKEQNSMTLELRAAVEEALSAVKGAMGPASVVVTMGRTEIGNQW